MLVCKDYRIEQVLVNDLFSPTYHLPLVPSSTENKHSFTLPGHSALFPCGE